MRLPGRTIAPHSGKRTSMPRPLIRAESGSVQRHRVGCSRPVSRRRRSKIAAASAARKAMASRLRAANTVLGISSRPSRPSMRLCPSNTTSGGRPGQPFEGSEHQGLVVEHWTGA